MSKSDSIKILEDLLSFAIKKGASDIHLSAGKKPYLRIDGKLIILDKFNFFDSQTIETILREMLNQGHSQERFNKFLREREIDFSYELSKGARFRGNAYFQQGQISCSLRFVPRKIATLEELDRKSVV